MLILTRKPGESIYIGDKIIITVSEIKGNQVRIGIKAPPDMRIFREEIYRQILEENKQAAEAAMDSNIGLDSLGEAFASRMGGQSKLSSKLGVSALPGKSAQGMPQATPQAGSSEKSGPIVTHKKKRSKTEKDT